jgi:hypothetical protein
MAFNFKKKKRENEGSNFIFEMTDIESIKNPK